MVFLKDRRVTNLEFPKAFLWPLDPGIPHLLVYQPKAVVVPQFLIKTSWYIKFQPNAHFGPHSEHNVWHVQRLQYETCISKTLYWNAYLTTQLLKPSEGTMHPSAEELWSKYSYQAESNQFCFPKHTILQNLLFRFLSVLFFTEVIQMTSRIWATKLSGAFEILGL